MKIGGGEKEKFEVVANDVVTVWLYCFYTSRAMLCNLITIVISAFYKIDLVLWSKAVVSELKETCS